jgi:hypothetical protein
LLPLLQKRIEQLCADGKFSDDDATDATTFVLKFLMGPMPDGLKLASRVTQPDAEHVEVQIGYNNDLDSSWLLVRFRHHEHKSHPGSLSLVFPANKATGWVLRFSSA